MELLIDGIFFVIKFFLFLFILLVGIIRDVGSIFYFLQGFLCRKLFRELLFVKNSLVVKWRMYDIRITMVAPKGKVSKAKNYGMILVLFVMWVSHMSFDISWASNSCTIWLNTDPVLATVATINARVINCFIFKVFFCPDVFWSTVGTVSFRWDSN